MKGEINIFEGEAKKKLFELEIKKIFEVETKLFEGEVKLFEEGEKYI